MRQLYEKIERYLRLVQYEDICPGFRRCSFALYNRDHVCLRDRIIPWDKRFIGNTSIYFEGDFIAIFQVESPREADAEILAADLVHEMFHAHQQRSGENRYPDDLKLLAYPENMDNYRLKYAENQLLAAAYEETGGRKAGLLAAFRAIRESRRKILGDDLEQELLAEHIEGEAEYAGCRALQSISFGKFKERMERYLSALRTVNQAFFDMRRQAYITGAVYHFVCADCGEEPMQSEFWKYQRTRKKQIEAFLEQKPVGKKGDYLICGYDPMNMIRSGALVLCTHFVILKSGEKTRFLDGPVLLKLKEGSDREAEDYWKLPSQEA